MTQSRLYSAIEQVLNVGSGFILSLVVWSFIIVPVYKLPVSTSENLSITLIFTLLSVVRGYFWRRLFNRYVRK